MLIFFSDSHLSRYIWKDRMHITGDAYSALHQIAELAVSSNKVSAVIAAGDIFDSRIPTSEDVWHFRRFCERLWQAGIGFFYVEGQHDRCDPAWPTAIHHHATLIDRRTVHLDGYSIYGLSHIRRRDLQSALALLPGDCDILVAHQLWEELLGAGPVAADASVSAIPHARMLYSGDMHRSACYEGTNAQGDPLLAISSGSTRLCRLGEPQEHFVVTFDEEQVQLVPLTSRPVVEVLLRSGWQKSVVEEAASMLRSRRVPADEWCDYKGILLVRVAAESANGTFSRLSDWAREADDLHVIRLVETARPQAVKLIRPADSAARRTTMDIARKFIEEKFAASQNDNQRSLKDCIRLAEAALRSRQDAIQTIKQLRAEYLF